MPETLSPDLALAWQQREQGYRDMREHLQTTFARHSDSIPSADPEAARKAVQSIAVEASHDVPRGDARNPREWGSTHREDLLIVRAFDLGQRVAIRDWSHEHNVESKATASTPEEAFEQGRQAIRQHLDDRVSDLLEYATKHPEDRSDQSASPYTANHAFQHIAIHIAQDIKEGAYPIADGTDSTPVPTEHLHEFERGMRKGLDEWSHEHYHALIQAETLDHLTLIESKTEPSFERRSAPKNEATQNRKAEAQHTHNEAAAKQDASGKTYEHTREF